MATTPQFTATPLFGASLVATANANRDGSGTIATVLAMPANGGRIDLVTIKALGNTTSGMIRLFVHSAGSHWLIDEIPVPPVTPGANMPSFEVAIDFTLRTTARYGLVLPANASLRASTHNAESFHVAAFGGSF